MKKILLLPFLVCIFSVFSFAQIFEDGKPAELKNLKKVFIASETSTPEYRQIREEFLRAKIPGLQIVDDVETADFSLVFVNEKTEMENEKPTVPFGLGMVFTKGANGSKVRIIMRYQSKLRELNTAVKFARAVIKKYKEVNAFK